MRKPIDALMQGGLEDWLAGQADMRDNAKKQAASRWTWGAAIAMPLLAFVWFSPLAGTSLAFVGSFMALMAIVWWGYKPIAEAKKAIKVGINSAIAASFGVQYEHDVEPGAEFDTARTYGLVPSFDRSELENSSQDGQTHS